MSSNVIVFDKNQTHIQGTNGQDTLQVQSLTQASTFDLSQNFAANSDFSGNSFRINAASIGKLNNGDQVSFSLTLPNGDTHTVSTTVNEYFSEKWRWASAINKEINNDPILSQYLEGSTLGSSYRETLTSKVPLQGVRFSLMINGIDQSQALHLHQEATDSSFSSLSSIENIHIVSSVSQDSTLIGDQNNNRLSAGSGNDTLIANGGTDILLGNQGDDTFVISSNSQNSEIHDSQGNNKLILRGIKTNDVALSTSTRSGKSYLEVNNLLGMNLVSIEIGDASVHQSLQQALLNNSESTNDILRNNLQLRTIEFDNISVHGADLIQLLTQQLQTPTPTVLNNYINIENNSGENNHWIYDGASGVNSSQNNIEYIYDYGGEDSLSIENVDKVVFSRTGNDLEIFNLDRAEGVILFQPYATIVKDYFTENGRIENIYADGRQIDSRDVGILVERTAQFLAENDARSIITSDSSLFNNLPSPATILAASNS